MKYILTKKFRFEMAHRLTKGYEGKCSNIHGHSWNGEIAVETDSLDEFDMAVDYAELSHVVKKLEERFDHSIVIHDSDTEIINLCNKNHWKYTASNLNPTCEWLSGFIFKILEKSFGGSKFEHLKVKHVRVEETCTTSCTLTN